LTDSDKISTDSQQIFVKVANVKFHEKPAAGSRADRRLDTHDKANNSFSLFMPKTQFHSTLKKLLRQITDGYLTAC